MSVPQVGGDAVQRIVFLAEVRDFVHVRRAEQPPVEVVGPRVVRALDAAGKTPCGSEAELGSAVPAHVVERIHPGRTARDDDALAEQLSDEELAGRLDLFGPPRADPHPREQLLHLALEVRAIDVEPPPAASVRAAA